MSIEIDHQILERKEFEQKEKDGYFLKQEHLNYIKDSFKNKNASNVLDLYELESALKKFGIIFNEDDSFSKELKNAKLNGYSKIDFDHFIDAISSKLSEMDLEQDLSKFFSLFIGEENVDKIEYNHLRKVAQYLKYEQIKEMIEKADKDRDGKINFEEFYDIITKKI